MVANPGHPPHQLHFARRHTRHHIDINLNLDPKLCCLKYNYNNTKLYLIIRREAFEQKLNQKLNLNFAQFGLEIDIY